MTKFLSINKKLTKLSIEEQLWFKLHLPMCYLDTKLFLTQENSFNSIDVLHTHISPQIVEEINNYGRRQFSRKE